MIWHGMAWHGMMQGLLGSFLLQKCPYRSVLETTMTTFHYCHELMKRWVSVYHVSNSNSTEGNIFNKEIFSSFQWGRRIVIEIYWSDGYRNQDCYFTSLQISYDIHQSLTPHDGGVFSLSVVYMWCDVLCCDAVSGSTNYCKTYVHKYAKYIIAQRIPVTTILLHMTIEKSATLSWIETALAVGKWSEWIKFESV